MRLRLGWKKLFQSTPPYWRRPDPQAVEELLKVISIHASVWEATNWIEKFDNDLYISIHASVWEATNVSCNNRRGRVQFQSTPPYGRRQRREEEKAKHQAFQSTPPYGRRPQIFNNYYPFFCSLIIYYEFCLFIVPDTLSYFI